MKKNAILPVLIALGTLAGPAYAQIGISGSAGTTGLGLHLNVPVSDYLGARFGINGLNYSDDVRTSNVDYDAKLKLRTLEALLDYYPTAGGLRFTGGVVYNDTRVTGIGRPRSDGTYTFNGTTYSAATAGELDARVDFRKFAPYLGIGYGRTPRERGWSFSADLGVLFQGSPDTSLRSRGCTAPGPLCSALAADLEAERREFDDDIDKYKAFPVIRIGASYAF